jgi:non-homologous end joining protein Ku
MSEIPEREPLSLRMDPSLQIIMKGFKKAMGLRTVDDVYDEAVREYIKSRAELAEQVQGELKSEEAALNSAISSLDDLRSQISE